jgi:hypothetical protein
VVARDDRMGGLAPRALLRRCLSLRHAVLICAMPAERDPFLADLRALRLCCSDAGESGF